jgi:transposase
MPMPTFTLARLGAFRAELHACFTHRADALMDLWSASDFAIENWAWIRQHPLGLLTREGGSDRDRAGAWQRPAGPARQAVPDAVTEGRDLAVLLRGETTIGEAADRFGVDRSTIMRLRMVAKDGALAALADSKPGVAAARREVELEAARAEAARLGEALKELAVRLLLVEGKGRWG